MMMRDGKHKNIDPCIFQGLTYEYKRTRGIITQFADYLIQANTIINIKSNGRNKINI